MQLMDTLSWKALKYMTIKDNWGDPMKMSKALVYNMENMRAYCGKACVLTCPAYSNSGHTPNSQHALGNAADVRILHATLLEMYILAERFNFTGIGLYPNNGTPFIHVDMRPTDPLNVQSRWIAIGDPNNWTYTALNEENIRKYVI